MRVPGLSSLVRAELENRFIQTPFTSPLGNPQPTLVKYFNISTLDVVLLVIQYLH